jgi:hypothetical protein
VAGKDLISKRGQLWETLRSSGLDGGSSHPG